MSSRRIVVVLLLFSGVGLGALQAAAVSEQQAEAFTKKMATVTQRGASTAQSDARGSQRTPFTEAEVNSWFVYRSREVLPVGVSEPRLTIVGDGKLKGAATVDLETIAKRRSTGRTLDPWSYLGGRLPVTVSGTLRTQDGVGRFELEEATLSGVSVPPAVLQDIVAYYSKTDDAPQGVRLDGPFKLPARIKQIEVGQGQAVVVQ
jgi:hypothetical protein